MKNGKHFNTSLVPIGFDDLRLERGENTKHFNFNFNTKYEKFSGMFFFKYLIYLAET